MMDLQQLLPFLAAAAGGARGAPAEQPPVPTMPTRPPVSTPPIMPAPMPDGGSVTDVLPQVAGLPGLTPEMQGVIDAPPRRDGFMDRIGDFLKSDEGRATMMRFAAGAAEGGLAGGLAAATQFADQRRSRAEEREDKRLDRDIRGRAVDQDYELGRDRIGVALRGQDLGYDTDVMREEGVNRRWGTPSGNAVVGERGANYRAQLGESGAYRRSLLDYDLGERRLSEDARQWNTPSGNTVYSETEANRRAAMGIGSKTLGTRTERYIQPGKPIAGTGLFGFGRDSTPEREITIETPVSEIQPGAPEVRYNGQGLAYILGPDGQPVRAPEYDRR